MKKSLLRIWGVFDRVTDHLFFVIQAVVSSKAWALGIIGITMVWFVLESFVAHRPVEGWFNGWLYTVYVYTILSLWVENFMKVQTTRMNKLQQEQMDRIEFVLRFLADQGQVLEKMMKDAVQKDAIIRHLVANQYEMARLMKDDLKDVK